MMNYNTFKQMSKADRADIALSHFQYCSIEYDEEIEACKKASKIYAEKDFSFDNVPKEEVPCHVSVLDATTLDAAFAVPESDKVAILNFASYRYPGGQFLKGSGAQEEFLCHYSPLYNILEKFGNTYYYWNRQHINMGLYEDRALYTPAVPFMWKDEERKFDVITCAAPNWKRAKLTYYVKPSVNDSTFNNRIQFMLRCAAANDVHTLVLGAWGCGVFAQDSVKVAQLFHSSLEMLPYFHKVIFAVPEGSDGNYQNFVNEFGGYK